VARRRDHLEEAQLLREVLDVFRPEEDTPSDRAIRRRLEGAVIATELAAGEPSPRLATGQPDPLARPAE